jgi:hypothetical protein
VKHELERVEIPREEDARQRAWAVLEAAFAERQPAQRPSRWPRVAAIALAVAAAGAAALSPPGRAVVDEIREVVGVERAERALFSVPASGRLLVGSDAGIWVVQQDGSRRLLGDYREAAWSPFGRYVAVARENELAALEPDGTVRWTLARPGVRSPRWTGSETNTRIAYITTSRVHVVAGDGRDDSDVGGPAARVPPAWRPDSGFTLTYVNTGGRVSAYDVDSGSGPWKAGPGWSRPFRGPRELEWSSDGKRLLLRTRTKLVVFGPRSSSPLSVRTERVTDVAFRPGGDQLAVVRFRQGASELVVRSRVLFRGAGELRDLAWSPDGRWILVTWPAADQWVFVRADGRGIRAVSNISEQFRSSSFPRVEGWCCAP